MKLRLGLAIDVILRSLALDRAAAGSGLEAHGRGLLDFVTGALEAPCSREAA